MLTGLLARTGAKTSACLVLIAFGLLTVGTEYAINNNDWYRVTQFGGFYPKAFTTSETSFPFQHDFRFRHSTTMGIGVSALASLARALSITEFPLALSAWTLHAAFALGLVLIVADPTLPHRWPIVALLLATYYLFGFYFFSFYEETAVLALIPLLCYGYMRMATAAACLTFSLAACAVIYSKIQMLFIAPVLILVLAVSAQGRRRSLGFILSGLLLATSCALAANSAHPQNREPNSYNRYYNGIGWSLLQSWRWPTREFNGRHAYFYSNSNALRISGSRLPHEELLGTSFWPTGDQMSRESRAGNTASIFSSIVAAGDPASFASQIARYPRVLASFVANTYMMSLVSDYSLNYLRAGRGVPDGFAHAFALVRTAILKYFGIVCAIALLLTSTLQRSWAFRLTALWLAVPLPALVVAGDGFFEFEKHMVPYMILLPFWAAVALQPPRTPDHTVATTSAAMSDTTTVAHRPEDSRTRPRGRASCRGASRRQR